MIRWFDQLNLSPTERRIAIFGACLVALLLNYWLIWPYFSEWEVVERDWAKLTAQKATHFKEVSRKAAYEKRLKELEGSGAQVMPEEQANSVQSSIVTSAGTNGVNIIQITPQLASLRLGASKDTNFFDEQVVVVSLSAKEEGLVSFLHALGSSASMIRVRDMTRLRLDNSGQNLSASVTFVASFQKAQKAQAAGTPVLPMKPAPGTASPAGPAKEGVPTNALPKKPAGGSSRVTGTNAPSKK
jgi:hypothetical protein